MTPIFRAAFSRRRYVGLTPVLLVMACADFGAPIAPAALPREPDAAILHSSFPARTYDGIYLADALGRNVTRLATGRAPAWSPDGSRIVFERAGMIIVIDLVSHVETPLEKGTWPAWSPDGSLIAFTSLEGISVMNVDGSNVRTLIRHLFRTDTYAPWDMGVGKPAWSPDGNRIAFEHLGDGDTQPAQAYMMNADGSNPRRFSAPYANYRFAESDPAWSPDGKRVVFWSYGLGIVIMKVEDGSQFSLYANFPYVAYGAKPAWSPDGQYIVFNTFAASGLRPPDLLLASLSRSGVRVLITDAHSAAWSPDGSRLAFVSQRAAKTK